MNIFVLDEDMTKSAQYLVDKHVVKMIVEHTQLMCVPYYVYGRPDLSPYKLSHRHHPCAKWVLESTNNWVWLRNYTLEICKEYTYRYGKVHSCEQIINNMTKLIYNNKPMTKFAQAMPEYCKCEDSIRAYRNYYINEKRHLYSWKGRDVPPWII